jgi:hypothetical protein
LPLPLLPSFFHTPISHGQVLLVLLVPGAWRLLAAAGRWLLGN